MESFLTSLLPIEVLSAKSVLAPRFEPRTSNSKVNTIPLHKRVWPKSVEKSPPSLHYCNKGCILPTCLNLNLPPMSHLKVLKWTKLEKVCSLDPPLDVTSRRAATRRQGGGPSTMTGGGGGGRNRTCTVRSNSLWVMITMPYAWQTTNLTLSKWIGLDIIFGNSS